MSNTVLQSSDLEALKVLRKSDIYGLRKFRNGQPLPLLIAGPCSAETEEQTLETARQLKRDERVCVYRAGVWKPRTRPNSFEGAGQEALNWLNRVQKEVGLKVATEVAQPSHAEACLKAGLDMLWVGARTTVSPFAMQELAEVLRGTDVPVFVKNPVTPDIQLWFGGVERLAQAGVKHLGVIHRGFTSYEKSQYRNPPKWPLAIEFRRKFPEIPMVIDPSHICGNTLFLLHIAQQAMDLAYDGMMIETHINPKEAWSDAAQQVTPSQLDHLLTSLTLKEADPSKVNLLASLESLRERIDQLDATILNQLSERMQLVRQIGQYKKENNITVLQLGRWSQIIERMVGMAQEADLSDKLVKELFSMIHEESIRLQEEIINPGSQSGQDL